MKRIAIIMCLLVILSSACGGRDPTQEVQPTADIEMIVRQTMEALLTATSAAVPTKAPTDTTAPTDTEVPTDIPTDTPTEIPMPTEPPTAAPTNTDATLPTEPPTETPEPVPSLTPTIQPTSEPGGDVVTTGSVIITTIFFDGTTGNKEPDEYVEIRNDDTYSIQLQGWTLRDEANHVFVFPDFLNQPGQVCKIYTNEIHPESCGFSFGENGSAIWNNGGDCALLQDKQGNTIAEYCY